MDKPTANKIKQLLIHYEYASNVPEQREKVLISLLGFLDGYVSAILKPQDN